MSLATEKENRSRLKQLEEEQEKCHNFVLPSKFVEHVSLININIYTIQIDQQH